ncbi:hypothetical protein C2S51_038039 [Perilla frutescens var. frutescens]|nr:hypothetical protein C2S51_038039 [Perilla frutescens var. frutescens]
MLLYLCTSNIQENDHDAITKKEIQYSREMIKDLYEKVAELQTAMKKDKDIEENGSYSVKLAKSLSKNELPDDEVILVDKKDTLQGKIVSLTLDSSIGLYCYAEGTMKNGEGVFIPLEDDVFGSNCEIYIHLEDIISFCDLDPISGNCMVVYLWHLYKKMKAERTLGGFRFVNPFTISHMEKTSFSARTQALGDKLIWVCPNQLVVVPCDVGSISLFNVNLEKKCKKQPVWEILKVPRQPEKIIESGSISKQFRKEPYSTKEIEEVRAEWANCVLDYV